MTFPGLDIVMIGWERDERFGEVVCEWMEVKL